MNHQPPSLSPLLCQAWAAALNLGTDPNELPAELIGGVLDLWRRFTGPTPAKYSSYLDLTQLRRAYLAYYLPVNLGKVLSLLSEMPEPRLAEGSQSWRVLDIGSGPGTGALAVLDWSQCCSILSGKRLEVTAVDVSKQALHEAVRLWKSYRSVACIDNQTFTSVHADVQQGAVWKDPHLAGRSFDLIIAANMLNEVFRDRVDPILLRVSLLRRLLDLLDHHGTLIVIEPALRETSRGLHQIRDMVLEGGGCNVYSPCLHQQGCPALVKKTDWCHEERPWSPPPLVGRIDRKVGFIKDSLKFSYLLLRKDGRHIVPKEPGLYRVVSELRHMKGERRAWLCHEQGTSEQTRLEVGRLDRERSEANAPFDNWHRGAIVRVENLGQRAELGEPVRLVRIRKTTIVELVRPICPTMDD